MDNKKHVEVLDHLTALRNGAPWDLFFAPVLEQNYQHSQIDWYRESIRVSSLLGVLLLVVSHLVEWITEVHPHILGVAARAVAILSLIGAYVYVSRSKTLSWKYWFVTANTILVTGALLILAHGIDPPIKQFYYSNIFFVEVVVFAFIRLPMNFTSTLGLVLLIMIASALYLDTMTRQMAAHIMFFLINGTIVALMVSLKTEKMSREGFLQSQLIYHEKNQLRELNDRLNDQMSLDRVTHLHNRMAFEDKLLSNWTLACSNKQPLIMIAIHVEQFAYFNEKNGSEAGDDLLREVARKIRATLADRQDLVARISGGRFLILFSHNGGKIDFILEKMRSKLLSLTALERYENAHEKVYLSWGLVELEPDSDRDPRGLIDRMYNYLTAIQQSKLGFDMNVSEVQQKVK